jgi:hypothetical protein
MPPKLKLSAKEIEFYKPLVAAYLRYGSVDKVFASLSQDTGVSYPHFHRILKQWGIVKSAGPQSHFAEAVYFLSAMVKEKLPLEAVYKKMPPSLKISAVTLHRILSYIKRGLVRRYGTALIISTAADPDRILIGQDISTPRPELGKVYGSFSLPMTYSKSDESAETAITRVLQQEVFAIKALELSFPNKIIPPDPKPCLYIDIADIRVACFRIVIPESLVHSLSSFKLANLTFKLISEVAHQTKLDSHYRACIPEIAAGLLETDITHGTIPHLWSNLNKELTLLPAYTRG